MRRLQGRVVGRLGLSFAVSTPEQLRRFLAARWPEIAERLPAGLDHLLHFRLNILVSDAWAPILDWALPLGGRRFLAPSVPDPFFAAGCLHRGRCEWLVVMWREGPRRFWFTDEYAVHREGEGFLDRSHERLQEALARWDDGEETVLYSSPFGWYEPAMGTFGNLGDAPELLTRMERAEETVRQVMAERWRQEGGG